MDFLEIRRRAKERAAAREGAAPEPVPSPIDPADPVDPVDGVLAAQLQGLPAPGPRFATPESRFTTWRPGSAARPVIPPSAVASPEPSPSDFAVYAPGSRRPVELEPAAVPLEAVPSAPLARSLSADPLPWARGGRPAQPADPLDEFFYRPGEEAPALPALDAGAAPAAAPEAPAAGIEEYLTFQLGPEEYAVPIGQVREVLKAPPITEVPRAPPFILGVVTVRGEVVAVFEPRRRLGLPGGLPPTGPPAGSAGEPPPIHGIDAGPGRRIVIVDDGFGSCGLLVDAVASVVRIPRGSIECCPQGIGGAVAECLAGIGRDRGRLFTVLDLPALLRRGPAPGRRTGEERADGVP